MERKNRVVHLMGTVIELTILHQSAADLILDEAVARLKEYEHRFSANDSSSELMEVNLNAGIKPVAVNPELYELIKLGKANSIASDSNLNIAIGPLVQSWRIGFSDAKVPSDEKIQQLLHKIDPHKIELNDAKQSVYLEEAGMLIDLGSLAKGYIADRIVDYLKRMKVYAGIINLGGNILVFGPARGPEDKEWRIGIQDPQSARNTYDVVLNIYNQSVVTSGIYERSLTRDGKTYHHILDPHTGYPLETDVVSLTIVSDLSVDGETWTTRLFGKNAREILQQLNQLEKIDGLVITKDQRIFYSDGLAAKIAGMR